MDPKCFFLFIDFVQVSWIIFMLRTFVCNFILGYFPVMIVLSLLIMALDQIGLQWNRWPVTQDSS